jgi:NADH dehydrogenase
MLRYVKFVQAEITSIDLAGRRVHCTRDLRRLPFELEYDHLLLAIGSETNFFGIPAVADAAMTMKTIGDAIMLRARILSILEAASLEPDAVERRRMLTFVVAGAGFAGVETVGAINDLARDALAFYPDISSTDLRFVLVNPGAAVLPELDAKLGNYARGKLAGRGVEIVLGAGVTDYRDRVVFLSQGEPIAAVTLIWTAGVAPPPIIAALPCELTKGRVRVDEFLQVPGFPNVWAVGDCASVPDFKTGQPQPPTAQHGMRQGRHAAENLEAILTGKPMTAFRFSALGQLASIGHRVGVANILGLNFSGFFAWVLWRMVYLSKLPGLVKKIRVFLAWGLDLFFSRDVEQLVSLKDIERVARATAVTNGVGQKPDGLA